MKKADKKYRAKVFAHFSIQFTMADNHSVDMLLTCNKSPAPLNKSWDASRYGRNMAEFKFLEWDDHLFIEKFCESYLEERRYIKLTNK